jgi:hypothetical protein
MSFRFQPKGSLTIPLSLPITIRTTMISITIIVSSAPAARQRQKIHQPSSDQTPPCLSKKDLSEPGLTSHEDFSPGDYVTIVLDPLHPFDYSRIGKNDVPSRSSPSIDASCGPCHTRKGRRKKEVGTRMSFPPNQLPATADTRTTHLSSCSLMASANSCASLFLLSPCPGTMAESS